MDRFIKPGWFLLVTALMDVSVRWLGRGEPAILTKLLDLSIVMSLFFCIVQHFIEYLELTLVALGRLFAVASSQMVRVRCNTCRLNKLLRSPENAPEVPCICGSGKMEKNCHFRDL